jgi:tetratricopeptide (TPR) repeat protein
MRTVFLGEDYFRGPPSGGRPTYPMAQQTTETKDIDIGEVYSRTELWLEKNKRVVTYATLGLVAVVAAVIGFRKFYQEPREKEAMEMIWKGQYYFEIDSLDLAIDGDGNYPGLALVAEDYGSTRSGGLAHYYLGAIYMKKGEYDLAVDHYGKADVEDDVLRTMAIGGIGDAFVELGDLEKASAQFEKAAAANLNDFTTPMYLWKAGLVHQQLGEWKDAARNYRRIVADFPQSSEANQAKKFAARAEAMGN